MAERDANDEVEAGTGSLERPREGEGELKAEQESAEAMDADVPHPPGFEEEEGRGA